ncbi:MAG: UDP binding domain-containing protein, partial [Tateyamaria sp.]
DGAATKPFGYMPFYPGPGLGGHCIPIDPYYLAWKARSYDVPTRFIELAGEINTAMPHHVISRTREVLDRSCGKGLSQARVLLVGVAYKKNVSDMRESPSMKLMQLLDEAGASVAYIDPHVPQIPPMRAYGQYSERQSLTSQDVADDHFDAVVIATDHDEIDYAALLTLDCPVIDTRNAMARRDLPLDRVVKV